MNLWKSVGKHILSVQLKSKSDSQESKLSYEVFKKLMGCFFYVILVGKSASLT